MLNATKHLNGALSDYSLRQNDSDAESLHK